MLVLPLIFVFVFWNSYYLLEELFSQSKVNLSQSTYRMDTQSNESYYTFTNEDTMIGVIW